MARTREAQNQAAREWRLANPLKALLTVARCRAKRKGLLFAIKESDFAAVPTLCPVLGIEVRQGKGSRDPNALSLDRLDSRKGYTPENVRLISLRANHLKSNATPAESVALAYYQAEQIDHLELKKLGVNFGS